MKNVFDMERTAESYSVVPLFFGESSGLFDTVNKQYPKIWTLYKEMKKQDWDENEVDYSSCNIDFKECPKGISDMMIKTLAWQWEADSVASKSIVPVLAPFISSSELWAAWQRISDNEVVHAATYSEIVRLSFDNPREVLEDVLSIKETLSRLEVIGRVFNELYTASHMYALKQVAYSQELYEILYKSIVALYMLERLQFMSSFAITFTICDAGWFQPIGSIVQKIATDELEIHAVLGRTVIETENKTERGKLAKQNLTNSIEVMFHEVVASEFTFVDYLFSEGRSLVGTNAEIVKQWVLYNAREVAKFLDIKTDLKFPKVNPMPHLDYWLDLNKKQPAPQEQDIVSYKVGSIIDDSKDMVLDF